jgi:hypothetical protein
MTKIEEGILKKLTAPLRRRKLVKQNNKLADDHEKNSKESQNLSQQTRSMARDFKRKADNTNYFHPDHAVHHDTAKTLDKVSDSQLDYSGKERGKSATAAIRSSRLQNKKRATPFGGLKEEMNPIKAGIKDIQEGRLEQMREKFNDSLARKAAEALQEKKLEIASNYFGQK